MHRRAIVARELRNRNNVNNAIDIVLRGQVHRMPIVLSHHHQSSLTVVADFPPTYPRTAFRDAMTRDDVTEGHAALADMYVDPRRANTAVHLSRLYIAAANPAYAAVMTPEERLAFKGIGRKLLYIALSAAQRAYPLCHIITLEASGGHCTAQQAMARYGAVPRRLLLLRLRAFYAEPSMMTYFESESTDELRMSVCQASANARLVTYYKTLGFKTDYASIKAGDGDATAMIAQIRDVLKASSTKARR